MLRGGLDHCDGGVSTYLGAPACENPKQKEGIVEGLGSAQGGDTLVAVWSSKLDRVRRQDEDWEGKEEKHGGKNITCKSRYGPEELERWCC